MRCRVGELRQACGRRRGHGFPTIAWTCQTNPTHVRLTKSERRLRLTMTFVFDFIPITV
jgi:hypothetical protein